MEMSEGDRQLLIYASEMKFLENFCGSHLIFHPAFNSFVIAMKTTSVEERRGDGPTWLGF